MRECYFIIYQIIFFGGGKTERLEVDYKGYILTIEDFKEVDENLYENIDDVWYDFSNWDYAQLKTFIIKLHYSNDDRIAIILNNDEDKIREMQEWRDYASEIAKKI